MGSRNQNDEVLKILRDSEYAKRRSFYKCIYPISNYDTCPYIGTLSEVISHLARHSNMHMYTCQLCTKEIYDPIEVYTHKDNSNRSCPAGPQNMVVHVPNRNTCVDWWRMKNVYIMTVTEADYNYFKAKQANIIMLESNRGPPGTPGYEDDLPSGVNVAPPSRTRHRSHSRVPNWPYQQGNLRQRHQSSTRGATPENAPPIASDRPWHRNRQTGRSPGPSYSQPRFSDTQRSGPFFPNRRSFTPSNRSLGHNSRNNAQNEQSIPPTTARHSPQLRSDWRRSPSPDIIDITPTKRTQEARARSPIDISPVRERSSTAAPFRRGREKSQISMDEQGSGTVSLAIQKPREMTRHRRSSVNYRSPAPQEHYRTGKDLEEIARNQQRFQVESRGTARVVPNRNRMAALLDPSLDAHWVPPESETVKRRRLEKMAKLRRGASGTADVQSAPEKNPQSTSTAHQSRSPPRATEAPPAPVPPPKPTSRQQPAFVGFRRSPPSDDDAPRQ